MESVIIILTFLGFMALALVIGHTVGKSYVKMEMVDCMRLTKDGNRCYNYVVLNEKE